MKPIKQPISVIQEMSAQHSELYVNIKASGRDTHSGHILTVSGPAEGNQGLKVNFYPAVYAETDDLHLTNVHALGSIKVAGLPVVLNALIVIMMN